MLDKHMEYVWKYFEIHANQRMTLFNYYITISFAVLSAIAFCIEKNNKLLLVAIFLSFLLGLISFIFWKFDQRTSFLIKHSESILKSIEAKYNLIESGIFSEEEKKFEQYNQEFRCFSVFKLWTYGLSFRIIFIVIGFISVLTFFVAMLRFFKVI